MTINNSLLIKHVNIYTEKDLIEDGALLVENGKITKVLTGTKMLDNYPPNFNILDGTGSYAIPGFIDGHIHGANGADVMDGTEEAIDKIASVLPQEGTTCFLATTITQSPGNIEKALKNIATYQNKSGYAEIIGVHLEGPFIEKKQKGCPTIKIYYGSKYRAISKMAEIIRKQH